MNRSIPPALLATGYALLQTFLVSAPPGVFAFGTDVLVNDTPAGGTYRATISAGQRVVAVRGDTVFVVWEDRRTPYSHIYFSRSLDNGATFETDVMVDETGHAIRPGIALGPTGEVYVAWIDWRDGVSLPEVYADRSLDGGATFDGNIRVDDLEGESYSMDPPSIAVCPLIGTVYVGWDGHDRVRVSRSLDDGASFFPSVIADDLEWGGTVGPVIATGPDGTLYAAWNDPRYIESYVTQVCRSEDGGVTFTASESALPGVSTLGMTVSPSGRLYLAGGLSFIDWLGHQHDSLLLARSEDHGASFDTRTVVSDHYDHVAIAVDDAEAVYYAYVDASRILLVHSVDFGDHFSNPAEVRDPAVYYGGFPSLAAQGPGRVYAVWTDGRDGPPPPPGASDIYFDAGEIAVTDVPAVSTPAVASVGFEPHVEPNPFRAETTVRFLLPAPAPDEIPAIVVYDTCGRRVADLPAVVHGFSGSALWRGEDSAGERLSAGIYFIRVSGPVGSETARVVFMP